MNPTELQEMKAAHRVLASLDYPPGEVERGYANRTLHVDLERLADRDPAGDAVHEGPLHRRQGLRPLPDVAGDPRADRLGRPGNGIYFSAGPLGGTPVLPGLGQDPGHRHLAARPARDRLQRRRLLRPAAQVRRLRRARGARQGGTSRDRRRSTATRTASRIETAPLEALDSHVVAEELHRMYAERRARPAEHRGRVGAAGAPPHAHGLLNFSFYDWKRQRAAPEAGRPRRARHRASGQEAQGARGHAPREPPAWRDAGARRHEPGREPQEEHA